ncbi:phage tail protein I [Streptomyces sp. NBS 14/10]|uniref:phage tail protein I n=1 Tax=Streptomyces sp. NBS 14/10 TaxID=1945643 RepID=UPI000B7CDC5F|nr:phage tail protein I [Streptomyces sp. NBS 14/10]KAK1185633.1 phage tail protein I [Streptomyces sp. NBS 14/10]NUS85655.1 phage tail protein I [Streptomyces sp.]
MTCAPHPATFRLLDAYVGWDESTEPGADGTIGIVGFDDPAGLRLAYRGDAPEGPTRGSLLPWFPDPRLAPGCGPCAWYLLVPGERRLLRRDVCSGAFTPVWPPGCDPAPLREPVSVAARGHRLAVVESDRVLVWRREGAQLAGVIRAERPRWAVLGPDDEVLVACQGSTNLRRYDAAGGFRGVLRTGARGEVIGLRTGPERTVWLLTDDGGRLRIHRGTRRGPFRPVTVDELAAALPPSTLTSAGEDGFCLSEKGPDGPQTTCFTWQGQARDAAPPATDAYVTSGSYVTTLIDSGISRCRWHRVRVDADVPAGTAVAVGIVVSEDGRYEDSDWQVSAPGATDFLVDQPPGRFLRLRLRLSGDGGATPAVRRIRLDFPRATSADLLPPAFRQDPAADDFTERFLSLFDATLAQLDRVIERYPALLDPAGVPDRVLPWLAGLLGLSYEAGWDAATRRALLAAAPELYRRRGTPWALREAVRIVFGVAPVIDELAADRRWAQLHKAVGGSGAGEGLGAVRLFGRSASRFRVGGSALGAAPLRAFGAPDSDPYTAHAHRFRVLLPAGSADRTALLRLVERQAPAHTVGSVRTGGAGFVVGSRSTVGVDTAFVPLPAPVLGGARPVRLNRDGVLRPGPRGLRRGVGVGVVSAVGVHTRVS